MAINVKRMGRKFNALNHKTLANLNAIFAQSPEEKR